MQPASHNACLVVGMAGGLCSFTVIFYSWYQLRKTCRTSLLITTLSFGQIILALAIALSAGLLECHSNKLYGLVLYSMAAMLLGSGMLQLRVPTRGNAQDPTSDASLSKSSPSATVKLGATETMEHPHCDGHNGEYSAQDQPSPFHFEGSQGTLPVLEDNSMLGSDIPIGIASEARSRCRSNLLHFESNQDVSSSNCAIAGQTEGASQNALALPTPSSNELSFHSGASPPNVGAAGRGSDDRYQRRSYEDEDRGGGTRLVERDSARSWSREPYGATTSWHRS